MFAFCYGFGQDICELNGNKFFFSKENYNVGRIFCIFSLTTDMSVAHAHFPRGRSAEGGPTQFWKLFTMIPCALRDFKGQSHHYFEALGSQIRHEVSFNIEETKVVDFSFLH